MRVSQKLMESFCPSDQAQNVLDGVGYMFFANFFNISGVFFIQGSDDSYMFFLTLFY